MKKIIAILMILLLSISAFPVAAYAQQSTQRACCERTLDGETCQFADVGNCDTNFRSNFASCEQTSYCSLGSCFIEEEGRCFRNTPATTCNVRGGIFFNDADCKIPQAQLGCCILGNDAFFTTQSRCRTETSRFPDAKMIFDEKITTEQECIDKSRSLERGACVREDGTCVFTTREACDITSIDVADSNETAGLRVGFHKGFLCSNELLGTECVRQQKTGCFDADVYWFDSCGNPENIYNANKESSYNSGFVLETEICNANTNDPRCGNCDYALGTLCGEAPRGIKPEFGNFVCRSVDCSDVFADTTSPDSGGSKKSGESWCIYEGSVGEGRDLVGSRHFRASCVNGEEIIEPCRDFREEICIQGAIGKENLPALESFSARGDFLQASCRENRDETCNSCNNIEQCGGECSSLSGAALKECCAKKCCEETAARDCTWLESGIAIAKGVSGVCVPEVPPGLKFWSEDIERATSTTRGEAAEVRTDAAPSADAESTCSQGDVECTVVFQRSGIKKLTGGDWECKQNCQCTKPDWVVAGNNLCKSLGDCGAYFNVAGKATLDGYSNTASAERKFFDGKELTLADVGDFTALSYVDKEKFKKESKLGQLAKRAIPPVAALAIVGIAYRFAEKDNRGILSAFSPINAITNFFRTQTVVVTKGSTLALSGSQVITAGTANIPIGTSATVSLAGGATQTIIPTELPQLLTVGTPYQGKLITSIAGSNVQAQAGSTVTAASSGLSTFLSVVNVLAWAYLAYTIIDVLLAQTKEVTYKVSCDPWQAPTGGNDCEKCNEGNKPCSLYKCKSYGQLCNLINPGTDEEKCVNTNPNDVNSPVVTAAPEDLSRGLTLTESRGIGYRINEEIEPFTPISLGINTNEPAQCKFDLETGVKYENMDSFFGSNSYLSDHNLTISLPSELAEEQVLELTQGLHTFYVKCQDAAGNRNDRDYFIRFKIKPGPDLTAPSIEETSIINNALLANNINETALSIFVNEPSECRWSREDVDYSLMQSQFSCASSGLAQSSIHRGLFECSSTLTELALGENEFFFRCIDQPNNPAGKRNLNTESFGFNLVKTGALAISSLNPSGRLFNGTVTLEVSTDGGSNQGQAVCGFSLGDVQFANMNQFLNTDARRHTQPLELVTGMYNYNIRCIDLARNEATALIGFEVAVDLQAPRLTYIFKDVGASILHVELDEASNCEYNVAEQFSFGDGTPMTGVNTKVHEASLTASRFFVKCRDLFGNEMGSIIYP